MGWGAGGIWWTCGEHWGLREEADGPPDRDWQHRAGWRAVAIVPGSVCASLSQLPPSAPRLTRGCGGTRPANLESGARATLSQLPGFTSSQRQLGGRGGNALEGSPGGIDVVEGKGGGAWCSEQPRGCLRADGVFTGALEAWTAGEQREGSSWWIAWRGTCRESCS